MRSAYVQRKLREIEGRAPVQPAFRGDRHDKELALRAKLRLEIAELCRPLFMELTPEEKAAIRFRILGRRCR